MEGVKDYYVEYIRVKQRFTKASKLQTEEVSKLNARLQYYQRENYALRSQLRKFLAMEAPNDYEEVLDNACKVCDITMDELTGRCRQRHLVVARHICFYILRNEFNLNLKQIGKLFNRDHASVIHGIKQMDYMVESPNLYKQEFKIYQAIKGI